MLIVSKFCLFFYGSQLWDLSYKELQYLDTAWCKAIRRICNLSYMTYSAILPFFADSIDFHALLCRRFYSFAHRCLSSVNMHVAFITLIICNSSIHNFGNNLLHITYSLKHITIPPTASVLVNFNLLRIICLPPFSLVMNCLLF